jgi:NTP pyrophosphatase (non-canonical NTP hydrolase)
MKFNKGDNVVIVGETKYEHGLPRGTTVKIAFVAETDDSYLVEYDEFTRWVVECDVGMPHHMTSAENFTFSEYRRKVLGHAFAPGRTSDLSYHTLGLAGEAGETANKVKKMIRDNGGVIDDNFRQQIKDELGDVLWYLTACAEELGETLASIAENNVDKLTERFGVDENGVVKNELEKFNFPTNETVSCLKAGDKALTDYGYKSVFPQSETFVSERAVFPVPNFSEQRRITVGDRVLVVDEGGSSLIGLGDIGVVIRADVSVEPSGFFRVQFDNDQFAGSVGLYGYRLQKI